MLRQARTLPLAAGERFDQFYEHLTDPAIGNLRRALAEALWAARRAGRASLVKDARRLADKAAARSVLMVSRDNESVEASRQAGAAAQFAIYAVAAAATRDIISEDSYQLLTQRWRRVADRHSGKP